MEIHDGWKNFQTHTFFFFAFDVRKIGKWKRLGPIWIKILGWMENVGEIAGWKIFRDEKKTIIRAVWSNRDFLRSSVRPSRYWPGANQKSNKSTGNKNQQKILR